MTEGVNEVEFQLFKEKFDEVVEMVKAQSKDIASIKEKLVEFTAKEEAKQCPCSHVIELQNQNKLQDKETKQIQKELQEMKENNCKEKEKKSNLLIRIVVPLLITSIITAASTVFIMWRDMSSIKDMQSEIHNNQGNLSDEVILQIREVIQEERSG